MSEWERYRAMCTATGAIDRDATAFFLANNHAETAEHCGRVAAEARRLASEAGVDPEPAWIAGWLHDISAIIPNDRRIAAAERWGVPVLPEEAPFPMIIHQKLSVVIARHVFGIADEGVLSAIGCHTTLKRDASALDTVLFAADKLEWDQTGIAPFHADRRAALETSVDAAALVYLAFLWERRATLRVLHPWLRDAYLQRAPQGAVQDDR